MPDNVERACPIENRQKIASALDGGDNETAQNLWSACYKGLVDNNPHTLEAQKLKEEVKTSGKTEKKEKEISGHQFAAFVEVNGDLVTAVDSLSSLLKDKDKCSVDVVDNTGGKQILKRCE